MDSKLHFRLDTFAALVLASIVAASGVGAQRSAPGRRNTRTNESRTPQGNGEKRFTFGVYTLAAPGMSITGEDIDGTFTTKLGEGGGVMLGYALTPRLSAYSSLDVAKQASSTDDYAGSTFGLAHFEIGARLTLPMSSPATVPYVSASIGSRAISAHVHDNWEDSDYSMSLTGTMIGLGGGVQHVLSPTMSLDAGLEVGFGTFTHYQIAQESGPLSANASTSTRLRVGLMWRR